MNNLNEREDALLDSLRDQKRVNVSKEAHDKSLLAFREGLKDGDREREMDKKPRTYGRKLTGMIAGAAVVGISVLLILPTGIMDGDPLGIDGNTDIGEEENNVMKQDTDQAIVQDEVVDNEILDKALNRPTFTYNDLNRMTTKQIFNENLEVHLPSSWTVSETEGDNVYQIQMTGEDGEQMKLLLFDKEEDDDIFDSRIQELRGDFEAGEEVTIPVDELVENIRMNREVMFPHPNIVPFDLENAEITAFYNDESGQWMEMYVSELFGYPMIFTSEFLYDGDEDWNNSILFFAFMEPRTTPFDFHESEVELHPVYERPIEKEVLLQVGAIGTEAVEVELYENEEIGLTSYLPKNTDIERIEHDHFVEWRFTEPNVSENSFYSFGKLHDGFPIEKGKEIMFEAHNLDLSYHEETDGPISHHYSYHDAEAFIDGYIELFEANGEWYYKHKHADRHDYNGGVYFQRLDMFIDEMEWH